MAAKAIKIILALLFFTCLADLPYGYYQFVRFAALIGFAFLAYQSYEQKIMWLAFIYVALAILFQPLFKISLGRDIWNIVDVVVGIFLLVTFFLFAKRN